MEYKYENGNHVITSDGGKEYTIKYCGSGDGDPEHVALWTCSCAARTDDCKHLKFFWAQEQCGLCDRRDTTEDEEDAFYYCPDHGDKCYFSTEIDDVTISCSKVPDFDSCGFPVVECSKYPCDKIKRINKITKLN